MFDISPERIPFLLAMITAAIAMVTDMRTGKIPNWLTFPMMLAGLAVNTWLHGLSGLGFSFLACAAGHILYGGFAMFGIVGMGDVKLLGALGALGGTSFVVGVFLFASLIGIPHALLIQFLNHGREGLSLLIISMKTGTFRNRTLADENKDEKKPFRFLLGLDILLGTILSHWLPLNIHW